MKYKGGKTSHISALFYKPHGHKHLLRFHMQLTKIFTNFQEPGGLGLLQNLISAYCFGTALVFRASSPPSMCFSVPDSVFSFSVRMCASQRPQHTKAFKDFPSS